MIQTKGVVHFTIPVSDLQRSESFYHDILGLEMVSRVPTAGMVFMKTGNDYLVLGKSDTPINPNSGDQIRVHHAFRVETEQYVSSLAILRENDIRILYEENRRDGVFIGRQAYFTIPTATSSKLSPSRTPRCRGDPVSVRVRRNGETKFDA